MGQIMVMIVIYLIVTLLFASAVNMSYKIVAPEYRPPFKFLFLAVLFLFFISFVLGIIFGLIFGEGHLIIVSIISMIIINAIASFLFGGFIEADDESFIRGLIVYWLSNVIFSFFLVLAGLVIWLFVGYIFPDAFPQLMAAVFS